MCSCFKNFYLKNLQNNKFYLSFILPTICHKSHGFGAFLQ